MTWTPTTTPPPIGRRLRFRDTTGDEYRAIIMVGCRGFRWPDGTAPSARGWVPPGVEAWKEEE